MPRTATRIAESLLPLIFQRKLKVPQIPMGNDLPEQGGIAGNMLAPVDTPLVQPAPLPTIRESMIAQPTVQEPLTTVAPNGSIRERMTAQPVIAPQPEPTNMLAPQEPVDPMVSRSGQVMDENAIRDRRVETNKIGRPIANKVLSGDEQTLDYQNRLATMQPDKEGGGWWPTIRAAIGGFAVGGIPGAAAAAGTRKLREHFDPTLGSREYRAQEMNRNAPAVEQIRQNRKDAIDLSSKTATADLARARTKALTDPKEKKGDFQLIERKDGVYRIDRQSGKSEKLADIPAEAGAPGSTRYVSRADGVYGINSEHPNGFKVRGIPANAAKGEEDVAFGNQQINAAIQAAQSEQAKIDAMLKQGQPDSIPRTIEGVDPLTGVKKMVSNPDYTYNMTRRRQLDDQIRDWQTKLKAPKKQSAVASTEDDSDPLGILNDE